MKVAEEVSFAALLALPVVVIILAVAIGSWLVVKLQRGDFDG